MDFSSPEGRSVNSETEAVLCSLNYLRLDQVVEYIVHCGRGSYLAKMDIASARAGQVFFNAHLPFGLRSAPKIFTGTGRPGEAHPVANHTRGVREA